MYNPLTTGNHTISIYLPFHDKTSQKTLLSPHRLVNTFQCVFEADFPDSNQPRLCPSFGPFMQIFHWFEEKLGHESFDAPAFIGIRDGGIAGGHWLVSVKFSEGSSCRLNDGVLLAFRGAISSSSLFWFESPRLKDYCTRPRQFMESSLRIKVTC